MERLLSSPAQVLVIDDDPVVTDTFARALRTEGYQVRTAGNAQSGLAEAERLRPDVIFLDLRMPLVDGLDVLRRLRARDDSRQTAVAIVTGDYFLTDDVASELGSLGAKLVFKPVWLEELVGLAYVLLADAKKSAPSPA